MKLSVALHLISPRQANSNSAPRPDAGAPRLQLHFFYLRRQGNKTGRLSIVALAGAFPGGYKS